MLPNILFFYLTILFYSLITLSISTPNQFPPKDEGFTASLIPPLSPRSPFYPQILAANNFPTTLTNITLNLTHYDKWFYTKGPISQNISQNDFGEVRYKELVYYWVMELIIGNPFQYVYGIFDTGSDIVWFQCEARAGIGEVMYYNQSMSNTYIVVNCKNPINCRTQRGDMGCAEDGSCSYSTQYSKGFSKGVMSIDVIHLRPAVLDMPHFVFGCSSDNSLNIPGIIGASNNVFGMPYQLYPNDPKFSYCYSKNRDKSSFIHFGNAASLRGPPIKIYRHPVQVYYYMDVIGIQVNGEDINVPPSVFAMSSDGLTGFIIDSGKTTTSLSSVAFDALKDKVTSILGTPTFHQGFEICYPVNAYENLGRPKISIKFNGSAYELEEKNVWYKMWISNLECLQVKRHSENNLSILGAEQLVNVNVGFDPNNNLMYLQYIECPFAT